MSMRRCETLVGDYFENSTDNSGLHSSAHCGQALPRLSLVALCASLWSGILCVFLVRTPGSRGKMTTATHDWALGAGLQRAQSPHDRRSRRNEENDDRLLQFGNCSPALAILIR